MSTNVLGTYLDKFKNWSFCPPSNNLWTITFLAASYGNVNAMGTLYELYSNIVKVNQSYDAIYSPLWRITSPNGVDTYMSTAQDSEIGLFLANEINFNGNSINIADSQSNSMHQYTGWASYGKTQTGRNHNHAAKIKFAETNWDLIDIFIDRWIAAIGQQGLIEDSTLPTIKANIVITEYSCGSPTKAKNTGAWVPRKKTTLKRAFPKSRQETKLTYDPETAGEMKYNIVDFEFEAYEVYYYDIYDVGYMQTNNSVAQAKSNDIEVSAPAVEVYDK